MPGKRSVGWGWPAWFVLGLAKGGGTMLAENWEELTTWLSLLAPL